MRSAQIACGGKITTGEMLEKLDPRLVIFRKGADFAGHGAGPRVGRIEGQTAG